MERPGEAPRLPEDFAMKAFEVRPGDGVGLLKLGMTREQARQAMGDEPESFHKDPQLKESHPVDAWFEAGFQVFYSGPEATVTLIELSRASGFRANCWDVDVFETPAEKVVHVFSQHAELDIADPELGCSYYFPALQLRLWRPFEPETDDDEEARYFSTLAIGTPTGGSSD